MPTNGDARTSSARRAARAHDDLVTALYGGELHELRGARLLYNRYLEEPTWSHAGAIEVEEPEWTERLASIRDYFRRRQRPPALVTDPWTSPASLPARLERDGWQPAFSHRGLLFPRETPVPAGYEWPAGATLEELGSPALPESTGSEGEVESIPYEQEGEPAAEQRSFPSMNAFVSVFAAAFAERAPGANLLGHRRAILAGFERPRAGVELVHTVVSIDGQPAAVGSRVLQDGVAGLYNLSVAPPYRRRGLGAAMTFHRVAEARASGAEEVFLLADDPQVESTHRKRGFVPAFELVGWTETAGGD